MFSSPVGASALQFSTIPVAWRINPGRNIIAGVFAALLSLPPVMGLGVVAFQPLGPQYLNYGVLAGLYGAAFIGLVAVLVGARGVAIYAQSTLISFMLAAVCAHSIIGAPWLPANEPEVVVGAALLVLALAGAFQFLFGLLQLSRLGKFIPTPVMAGFQNAGAISIFLSQVPLALGLASHPALAAWPKAMAGTKPLSLAVAVATYLLIMNGARITRRVPPPLVGLIGGTLLYYLLVAVGLSDKLGSALGAIPVAMPDGRYFAGIISLPVHPGFLAALPGLILDAASIAVIASLDVLIRAKFVENISGQRDNATHQLLCVGAANTVTPLLGGISGTIAIGPTIASIRAGGTNSLALFVHGALFLVIVPIAAPILAYLPQAVLGAFVAYVGVHLFDRWTLRLARRALTGRPVNWRGILLDLFVIGLVTGITLTGRVVLAVTLGISIAVIVFTLRMSRGVIRSLRYGDEIHSRRAREAADVELLAKHGRRILAIELEGPLFFASAEKLGNSIDRANAQEVRYVILDVARVNELDSTAAHIILQCCDRMRRAGVHLLMCGHDERLETASLLRDHGVAETFTAERLHPDLDRALEWCENELLEGLKSAAGSEEDRAFESLDIAKGLGAGERAVLREMLLRREYAPGAAVFAQNDAGDALYVILRGSASVRLVDNGGRERRLVTFSAGTLFGEMALLDRQPRSATVIADQSLTCYVLERETFEGLSTSHPHIAVTLIANIARELSLRMRRANRALAERA